MELQFIGHSAFYLETEKAGILIDPFISESPVAKFDPKSKIDAIFVTHAHSDHLGDAIPLSKKTGATITAVYELANYCEKRGANAQRVNIGGTLSFPWGNAKIFSAAHSSSTVDGAYAGCPCSIMLEINGIKIYFAGDTGLHQDMKTVGEFYKPDIAALPVGDIYTMGIEEAAIAAKWLGTKKVIPIHYKSFDVLKADTKALQKLLPSDVELVVLEPGQKIEL
ncbi:MAG: metal-dependent hydrolase [bacterium]